MKFAIPGGTVRVGLQMPVIMMIVAATAIPIEWRPPGQAGMDFSVQASDIIANIVGYVPVGVVLAEYGTLRALVSAVLLTVFAETSQFAMMHRDPSVVDIASNVLGAILGIWLCGRWRIPITSFRIDGRATMAAATLALMVPLAVWTASGDAPSVRGTSSPGILEAYWKLDESRGRDAIEFSGNGLNGKYASEPRSVAGAIGGAVRLVDPRNYVDIGRATAFRIVGSMTVSAWINSVGGGSTLPRA